MNILDPRIMTTDELPKTSNKYYYKGSLDFFLKWGEGGLSLNPKFPGQKTKIAKGWGNSKFWSTSKKYQNFLIAPLRRGRVIQDLKVWVNLDFLAEPWSLDLDERRRHSLN